MPAMPKALRCGPSLQPFTGSGLLPPVQFGSPLAGVELSEDRFWPGANSALILKPPMLGDSYHAACESLVSNSARLSPPVLPMMLRSEERRVGKSVDLGGR